MRDLALPRGQFGAMDAALLGVVGTFVVWVMVLPTTPTFDAWLDYVLFAGIGLLVSVLQFQVSRVCVARRERLAWRLLAASSAIRAGSGVVWSLWVVEHPGESRPLWMLAFAALSLLLWLGGLLAFGGEARAAMDRRRQLIDGVIVLVGIVTSLWFAALGPFFAASGEQLPRLEDYIYLLADSASVVVAALLVLRRSQRYLRHVAALLLVAAMLQTIPDVLLWAGKTNYSYRPGDGIALLWFTIWVLKAAAARYALHVLRDPAPALLENRSQYESGAVPAAFVLLASVVLVVQLITAPQQSKLPLVISVCVLSMMLVWRQLVEVQEQERVQQEQHEEALWYGAVLRDTNDYVMVLDADGNSIDVSPAARRLVDMVGASSRWALLSLVHPEDQHKLRQALAGARDRPTSLVIRVPDEVPDQWRLLALTIVDRRHDEDAGAVLLHAHDITRESQLSERLRQSEELEALGVFAGGLAHDLNNILTVVDAHAEMIEDDLANHEPLRGDVAAIRHASERARRFTRGLLTLSRRKPLREESIDVAAMIRTRVGHAGLADRLTVRLGESLEPLSMDPSACHLAVDSLLLAVIESDSSAPATAPPPELLVRMVTLSRVEADHLHVEPGLHLLMELRGLWDVAHTGTASPVWDGSATQLALMLANAAAREVGGVQHMLEGGTVQTYLPAENRE